MKRLVRKDETAMTRTEKQQAAANWRAALINELRQELLRFIDQHPDSLGSALWEHGDAWLNRKIREMPQRRAEIIRAGQEAAKAIADRIKNDAAQARKPPEADGSEDTP